MVDSPQNGCIVHRFLLVYKRGNRWLSRLSRSDSSLLYGLEKPGGGGDKFFDGATRRYFFVRFKAQ